LTIGLILALGLFLCACAVEWGKPDDTGDSSEQTLRDRNLLYREEQQRIERNRQLDRGGPSDR